MRLLDDHMYCCGCNRDRGLLSAPVRRFIRTTVRLFGPPKEPFVLRQKHHPNREALPAPDAPRPSLGANQESKKPK
jgi:hypothetical protein